MKKNMINYLISVLSQLNSIHFGTLEIKAKATVILSLLLSPIVAIPMFIWTRISAGFTSWFDLNFAYIMVVFGAVAVDHLFGSYRHAYIDKDFNWKQNVKGLFFKIAIAICGAFLFEGIDHIIEKDSILKDYIQMVCRLIVFLYPAGSAFGNMSVVTGGKFPPKAWMDKLSKFNENLNPEDLKPKQE